MDLWAGDYVPRMTGDVMTCRTPAVGTGVLQLRMRLLHSVGVLRAAVQRAERQFEMFMPSETWYDAARGGALPVSFMQLNYAATELVQSAWAPATRLNYQGYVIQWIQFCACVGVRPLPVVPAPVENWVPWLLRGGHS